MIRRFIVTAIFFGCAQLHAQPGYLSLDQRVTDVVGRTSSVQLFSATRYMPIVSPRGLANWSAPANIVEINNMPFEAFPLNLVSPDYTPFELVLAESVEVVRRPVLTYAGAYPAGLLSLGSTTIPDSLLVFGRMYGGSETGDIILDEYTKDGLPFYNRNKIGFSGAAGISNRLGRFTYRLTAAGFNYFSVGYKDRDPIILSYIDAATFSRPNRNYIGIAELIWDDGNEMKVMFYGGMNSFAAWEQLPFASTFGFFSGTLGTTRLSIQNVMSFLSVAIRRDAVSLSMRNHANTDGGSSKSSVTALHTVASFDLGRSVSIALPFEYAVREFSVPSGNRQFLTSGENSTTWAAGFELRMDFEDCRTQAMVRSERGFTGKRLLSGSLVVAVEPSERSRLELSLSSVERSPTPLERSGIFSTIRYRPVLGRNDTLTILGNRTLRPARTTGGEITYSGVQTSIAVFAFAIDAEIRRRPVEIIRSASPGDVVFSGSYENRRRRMFGGVEVGFHVDVSDRTDAGIQYVWTQNHSQLPRHQARASGTTKVMEHTSASVVIHGMSRTHWPEFAVLPGQDDLAGTGSDGIVPEFWTIDCVIVQSLGKVWFIRGLEAKLELQNLLNRELQTFPIGVTRDFAVIGYLSFKL
ncbi:MAG: hypothetical protein HY563_02085 [Ignavibacteriales bacterium]|nr:hypothetical protein [Ignavibacteriales bacterium]